jgi:REP element-mobilizing transposase RayT
MILGFHCIFGAYGFWLPNDPRGSWSDYVASWELFRFGHAKKTASLRSLAKVPHDRSLRLAAKEALKYPAVELTGLQARAVGNGFKKSCEESGYVIHACSVLPEHVHLVIGRHSRDIRRIVGHLKGRATQQLTEQKLWPTAERPVWAERGWNVFLDNVADVKRAILYVEDNPLKEGKPRQHWSFVRPWNEHDPI